MRLAALCVVVGVLGGARPADAWCGTPEWVSEPRDRVLPRTGSLLIHSEDLSLSKGTSIHWEWSGRPGWIVSSIVSKHVMRLDYIASEATELIVSTGIKDRKFRFGDWEKPSVRVHGIRHLAGKWTCSSYDFIEVAVDERVAGFRVSWISGGRTTTWIEAARPASDNTSRVQIGRRNCGDREIDVREIYAVGTLELVAIHFDGSESLVEGTPMWVDVPLEEHRDEPAPETPSPLDDDGPIAAFALLAGLYAAYRAWLARL